MNLSLLLEMAVDGSPERVVLGSLADGMTAARLGELSTTGGALVRATGARHLVFVASSGPAFAVALFAASAAGVPFVPLNYRLPVDQLLELLGQNAPVFLVADPWLVAAAGLPVDRACTPEKWLALCAAPPAEPPAGPAEDGEDSDIALLLYTSGTTAAPKAAVLRHRNLTSYVLSTVDFQAAGDEEASLVSVPPYHIAGIANTITNLYAGRRIVALPAFTAEGWLQAAAAEQVTHALVVPTMLARIVEHLERHPDLLAPALRVLAYGGAPMPSRVVERALALFPGTDFVNAYGLTETSSTIALLGPQEHRDAVASSDPVIRGRLGSAGRSVPGIALQVRDPSGAVCATDEVGELFVSGDQVSGEYRGVAGSRADGWFATRDRAFLDAEGYLFIEGRADDTIIRGGENIAPAEIEHVLQQHPAVAEVAVVGLPDEEWGQRIVALVVVRTGELLTGEQLQAWARPQLRTAKTPDQVFLVAELPRTDSGKLLRRKMIADLSAV